MKAGMRIVEVRHEASRDREFNEIEVLCSDLDEAKEVARAYLQSRGVHGHTITWGEGSPDKNGPVYYASIGTSFTLRIRQ